MDLSADATSETVLTGGTHRGAAAGLEYAANLGVGGGSGLFAGRGVGGTFSEFTHDMDDGYDSVLYTDAKVTDSVGDDIWFPRGYAEAIAATLSLPLVEV